MYSKMMFLGLGQVYYSRFKCNAHNNCNFIFKLNEIIIGNYLQQKKKHQAK